MEIKRVTETDTIDKFTDIEFSGYASDCDVQLNYEEFCFIAEEGGNIAGVSLKALLYNRFDHWFQGTANDFKGWYVRRYLNE